MGAWGVTKGGRKWEKLGDSGDTARPGEAADLERAVVPRSARKPEKSDRNGGEETGRVRAGTLSAKIRTCGKEGVEVGASIHEAGLESSMSIVASEGWQW